MPLKHVLTSSTRAAPAAVKNPPHSAADHVIFVSWCRDHLSKRHELLQPAVTSDDQSTQRTDSAVALAGRLLGIQVGPLRGRIALLERTPLLCTSHAQTVVEISLTILLHARQPVYAARAVVSGCRVAHAACERLRRLCGQGIVGMDAAPRVSEQLGADCFDF